MTVREISRRGLPASVHYELFEWPTDPLIGDLERRILEIVAERSERLSIPNYANIARDIDGTRCSTEKAIRRLAEWGFLKLINPLGGAHPVEVRMLDKGWDEIGRTLPWRAA